MSNDEYQHQSTWEKKEQVKFYEGLEAQIEAANWNKIYKPLTMKDIEDFISSFNKNINESKF